MPGAAISRKAKVPEDMSRRHAILHIGVMKTGSKAIQSWMTDNRALLGRHGVHVPESLGSNHSILGNLAVHLGDAEDAADGTRLERLRTELEHLPTSIHTVLFSGETMSRSLRGADRIAKLKDVLDRYFASYRVLIYLRRQDQQALSQYSSDMRRGIIEAELFSKTPLDYDQILAGWTEVFGRAAITPRLYETESLVDGDVVADFVAALDLPRSAEAGTGGKDAAKRPNAALSPPAIQLLRDLSALGKDRGLYAEDFAKASGRKELVGILDRHFSGRSALPSRAEAMAFHDRCRDSNERVRAAWFPDRATLFQEDFSRYPEVADLPPSADAVLPVALVTILELMAAMPARERQRTDKVWVTRRAEKRSARAGAPAAKAEEAGRSKAGKAKAGRGKKRAAPTEGAAATAEGPRRKEKSPDRQQRRRERRDAAGRSDTR